MTTSVAPFRHDSPLPGSGVTVLEASAGTGKTAALAALVTRFVAEQGVPLAGVLAVTFTRAATVELRERVRRELERAATFLHEVAGGRQVSADDPLLHRVLADAPAADVAVRRTRLDTALATFDTATITTIHGFCRQALLRLGLAADHDPDAELLPEPADVVDAVIDDVLAASDPDGPDPPPRRELADGVRKALANPTARVGPTAEVPRRGAEGPAGGQAAPAGGRSSLGEVPDEVALRISLVEQVRRQLGERLAAAGATTYDGLVAALDRSLADPQALALLHEHYAVVLVDEFQDTDHTQWDIFRRICQAGTAVLIGDPKQAIYAFRGADVDAYLDAIDGFQVAPLDECWRCDERLLDGLNALFEGVAFGDERIAYQPVRHAPHLAGQRITHPAGIPVVPLEVRLVQRDDGGEQLTAEYARGRIVADVAQRVAAFLGSGCTVARDDGTSPELRASDLAVLTRTNAEARMVQRKLAEAGIPAVLAGAGEVLDSPAATAWQALLAALERPSASSPARALALTAFVGWSAERVATAAEAEWDDLHERLHRWAHVLARHGVATVYRVIAREEELAPRVLRYDGGERTLADLDHMAEVLEAGPGGTSPIALAAWLREERAAARDRGDEAAARRLETDAPAVTVMTVHRAKGLEFGVVYVPFLALGSGKEWGALAVSDPATGRRMVHVGGAKAPDVKEARARAQQERWGEDLRLLYVALTRARHRAIVWWAPVRWGHEAPLTTLLFCRDSDGALVPDARAQAVLPDERARAVVDRIGARSGGALRTSRVLPLTVAPKPSERPLAVPALAVADFGRDVDRTWRRTSYSALVAGAHASVGVLPGEPEHRVKDDEPDGVAPTVAPAVSAPAPPPAAIPDAGREASPLAALAGGAAFGTFVHAVLEQVDFAGDALADELCEQVPRQAVRAGVGDAVGDGAAVAAALERVLETPLGGLVGGLRLRDLGPEQRRDELWFEIPLGDRGAVDVHAIADLLDAHLAAGDPLRGYGAVLRADPSLGEAVRGFLAGAIDLVLAVPGQVPGYAVVDYKTTTLGEGGGTLWDYRPSALAGAMAAAHYPLQALLYLVALHRYLRWRQPGYDPATHLAGVLYLFVRGMAGAGTPLETDGQPCGVFSWRPPAALVTSLSDLLDGGTA